MVVRVGGRAGEGYSRGYGVVVIVHQAYCRCKVRVTEKTVYLICLRDRNGGGGRQMQTAGYFIKATYRYSKIRP